jgi:2-keto-4-pentenoate hydratase/2-oxohepta-3-ene-1,7-dioic acid hydratase in catechol pathway
MKFFRFGAPGDEQPGIVDADGQHRSLATIADDIDGKIFSSVVQARLRACDLSALPIVDPAVRFGPCIANVGQMFGVGLNYGAHAAEMKLERSTEPTIFVKSSATICGCNDALLIPYPEAQVDWEVELAVIIGTDARSVSPENALAHVGGYCVANDVTDRRMQFIGAAPQWSLSKSFDGFAPLGPYLVTADAVHDYRALQLWTKVNGQRVQADVAGSMLMPVAEIIAYLASFLTLRAGDVILTGSPAGSGKAQNPPRFVHVGDVIETGIDGLGSQRRQADAYAA